MSVFGSILGSFCGHFGNKNLQKIASNFDVASGSDLGRPGDPSGSKSMVLLR